ncbi:hypothetical protein [Microbacterium sp.]|uniref:hypothetical protein n=1 Tax=Microbacterium sp. TaxID=51671 RepID=UPI0033407D12
MSRIANVVRLHLINRQTFIWMPLIILFGALALSILVFALIPYPGPKYGGAGQAPLWYFFAIGIFSLNLTFPFSQAMSVTRREFFLGTMLTAAAGAVVLALLFLLGGWIEDLTHGWGLNGYFFRLAWVWEAGPLVAALTYFGLALLLFSLGFIGATIYRRWGPMAFTVVCSLLGFALVGLVFLLTRLDLWGAVGDFLAGAGVTSLALMSLGVIVVLSAISYLGLRRATP